MPQATKKKYVPSFFQEQYKAKTLDHEQYSILLKNFNQEQYSTPLLKSFRERTIYNLNMSTTMHQKIQRVNYMSQHKRLSRPKFLNPSPSFYNSEVVLYIRLGFP